MPTMTDYRLHMLGASSVDGVEAEPESLLREARRLGGGRLSGGRDDLIRAAAWWERLAAHLGTDPTAGEVLDFHVWRVGGESWGAEFRPRSSRLGSGRRGDASTRLCVQAADALGRHRWYEMGACIRALESMADSAGAAAVVAAVRAAPMIKI